MYHVQQAKGINIIEPYILEFRAKKKALDEWYNSELERANNMSEEMLKIEIEMNLNKK